MLANGGVDDTIDGGAGADSIYGGAANDYIKYYSADAIVSGGAGTDTLAATSAGTLDIRSTSVFSGIEFLLGSSGDDVLRGATGNETLSGGVGADHLWGYSGADSMNGGVGSDTYWFTTGDGSDTIADDSLNASTDAVILNNLTFSSLTFGVLTNDNLVIDIGTGADSLTLQSWLTHTNTYRVNKFVTSDKTFGLAVANDTATNLTGTSYDDYMKGGAGNDTLTAGVGADSLYGGGGNDVLKYNATGAIYDGQTGDADTLTAASMTSAVDISLYNSQFANIEYLQGSSLNDILRGTTLADTVEGGSGADQLWGNKGNDVLIGGVGADTYWFGVGDGSDTITDGGALNAYDVVNLNGINFSQLSFARTTGASTNSDLTITVGGDATNTLVLANWGSYMGTTSTTNRIVNFVANDATFGLAIGTTSAESLFGSSLADYILGNDGGDTISGGAGSDSIYGQGGDDQIVYKSTAFLMDGGDGTDTVNAASATASSGHRPQESV